MIYKIIIYNEVKNISGFSIKLMFLASNQEKTGRYRYPALKVFRGIGCTLNKRAKLGVGTALVWSLFLQGRKTDGIVHRNFHKKNGSLV